MAAPFFEDQAVKEYTTFIIVRQIRLEPPIVLETKDENAF